MSLVLAVRCLDAEWSELEGEVPKLSHQDAFPCRVLEPWSQDSLLIKRYRTTSYSWHSRAMIVSCQRISCSSCSPHQRSLPLASAPNMALNYRALLVVISHIRLLGSDPCSAPSQMVSFVPCRLSNGDGGARGDVLMLKMNRC